VHILLDYGEVAMQASQTNHSVVYQFLF